MKLSKLYCDNKLIFSDLRFNPGMNIVLASVEKQSDKTKDSHNLGKTSLGKLIDYCFLKEVKSDFFLYQNPIYFEELSFFLEIENGDSFITVKRSVKDRGYVSIICHLEGDQDFSQRHVPWLHHNIPIKKAKEILNAYLNWGNSKDFPYRDHLAYFLRTQDEYKTVFKLNPNLSDKIWKPIVAELLGFDALQVEQFYSNEELIKNNRRDIIALEKYLPGKSNSSKLRDELTELHNSYDQKRLSFLNMMLSKSHKSEELANKIDQEISDRSQLLYRLKVQLKKIDMQLTEKISKFDLKTTESLYREVKLFFPEQIKRDFDALLLFNREITTERKRYLSQTKKKLIEEINEVETELSQLESERESALNFLKNADIKQTLTYLFGDMRKLAEEIANRNLKIEQEMLLEEIKEKNTAVEKRQDEIIQNLNRSISEPDGIYLLIREIFRKIIEKVLNARAELNVSLNKSQHLDFKTNFINADGSFSKASEGHSYQKILCVAFDLAVLRSRITEPYSRFVFHDGVLESLDKRKKENLIELYRDLSAQGLQIILTAIASDIPSGETEIFKTFSQSEIIIELTENNRLFKVPPW